MAKLIVISWRDIPAQVVVKKGRETGKVQLSHRFQEAVDRAAMRAGKSGSADYLADWQRSAPRACSDEMQMEADAEAAKIEARYSDEDLLRLIRAHGVDETLAPAESAVDANTNTATDSATNTVTLTTPTQETP